MKSTGRDTEQDNDDDDDDDCGARRLRLSSIIQRRRQVMAQNRSSWVRPTAGDCGTGV